MSWRHFWHLQHKKLVYVKDDTKLINVKDLVQGKTDPLTKLYVDCSILSSNIYKKNIPTTWKRYKSKNHSIINKNPEKTLAIEVWESPVNSYIAIVFRGTIFTSFNSWVANLHWLFRYTPIRTQYEEIQKIIPSLVAEIIDQKGDNVTIITTGHSLGGGLAQHANYLSNKIKYSFVFNTSPVTAWSDVKSKDFNTDFEGARIYRLYERGEVLQFLHFFIKISYLFNPKANINPYFVEHRLNLSHSTPIKSHGMEDIAKGLKILHEKYLK